MQLALTLSLVAFGFCLWVTPLVRNLFLRLDYTDQPDAGRKVHLRAVPRLGGISIISACCAVLVSAVLYFHITPDLPFLLHSSILALLIPALLIFCIGLYDDLWGLAAQRKLVLQTAAATLACLSGYQFSAGGQQAGPVAIVISIFWLVACTNAFNLVDGLDGLASGLGVLMAAAMAIAGFVLHIEGLTLGGMVLCGALLGFLRYNLSPASIFLGDSGSLTAGFLLGGFAILWSNQQATVTGKFAPVVVWAVPLLDLGVSVLRRSIRGVPLFAPDRGHIHHRLLTRGLSTNQTVLCLCATTAIACAVALILSLAPTHVGVIALTLLTGAILVSIQQLNYAEFNVLPTIFRHFSWKRFTATHIALENFKHSLIHTVEPDDYWDLLKTTCREFGCSEIKLVVNGQTFEEHLHERMLQRPWGLTLPLGGTDFLMLRRGMIFGEQSSLFLPFLDVVQNDLIKRCRERQFVREITAVRSVQARTFASKQQL